VELDYDELQRANEELKRELAVKANGIPCVILVRPGAYAEVLRKDGDLLVLAFWNRLTRIGVTEAEQEGYKAVPAHRIIKGDGTLMYYTKGEDGTDWYISGKHMPAIRRKR
jgi:hypothetical protein